MNIERSTVKNQMIATLDVLKSGKVTEMDVVNYITEIIWSYQEAIEENAQLIQALQVAVQDKMTEDIITTAARNFIDHQGLKREFSDYLNRGLSEIGSDILGPVQ
ncbi:hypothetical protein BK138_08535 [Paenibacillus rhizosphaerae]|uniref:Uncharacterized protein n=1 Tax=Paenibacillus rhizosphaerae TaxID=297318 RepID=A0A1R1F358_9BACL|nr:hypothetical protein [Paenibacillus rhizosphaerae]OMF58548.1 hypothetical protein BK138_08535 [Paenibacillus rhizosphaerae]